MSISQLCISVLLSTSCTISRWIQNFRRTAGLNFSAFHDRSIEQSVSVQIFLGQLQTGCNWLRTKYARIHLSTEWDCFFPENWTDFLFQELPEETQSKIVYIYSVINDYSLRSRDVHSTPSWHKGHSTVFHLLWKGNSETLIMLYCNKFFSFTSEYLGSFYVF